MLRNTKVDGQLAQHFLGNVLDVILQDTSWIVYSCVAYRCYQAILNTIQPLLPRDSKYHDQHLVELSFEKMLPSLIALTNDALTASPDPEWILICEWWDIPIQIAKLLIVLSYQLAKNVIIALASYKPYSNRAYQKDIYIYLAEQTKFDLSTDPQGYLETLMRVST